MTDTSPTPLNYRSVAPETPPASSQPACNTAIEAASNVLTEHPMTAVLTSALIGAGLFAALASAWRAPASAKLQGVQDQAADSHADLRTQLRELTNLVVAALPARSDLSRTVDEARGKADDALAELREQARTALDHLSPHIDAAVGVARANPIWASVIAGAIGALVGAQLMGRHSTEALDA